MEQMEKVNWKDALQTYCLAEKFFVKPTDPDTYDIGNNDFQCTARFHGHCASLAINIQNPQLAQCHMEVVREVLRAAVANPRIQYAHNPVENVIGLRVYVFDPTFAEFSKAFTTIRSFVMLVSLIFESSKRAAEFA
ncbi:hypothetical protein LCGC14_0668810 [marine sediment metagenome]|uniref:Uncharacterized protein n=1 Tax=marine sediment metagenome TaxID=412755 RepID=A0A0F9QWP9_9ZZZZ